MLMVISNYDIQYSQNMIYNTAKTELDTRFFLLRLNNTSLLYIETE